MSYTIYWVYWFVPCVYGSWYILLSSLIQHTSLLCYLKLGHFLLVFSFDSIGYSLYLRVFVCILAVWNKLDTFICVIPAYWFSVCCLTKRNIPHMLFSVRKDERMLEYGGVEMTEKETLACTVIQFWHLSGRNGET